MSENAETKPRRSAFGRYLAACQGMTERDHRNARVTNTWLFVWMATFLGLSLALRLEYLEPGPLAWAAVGVCAAVGLVVVRYYLRFLHDADELLRKIQLEALGVGFGAAFVGNFVLSLVERLGAWTFGADDLFLMMVVFYMIGIVVGTRRYA